MGRRKQLLAITVLVSAMECMLLGNVNAPSGNETTATVAELAQQRIIELEKKEVESAAAYLQRYGVTMNREGIRDYLKQVYESNRDVNAKKLIAQLGSDSFEDRTAAQQTLMERSVVPMALLQEATQDADPEIARRSKVILTQAGPRQIETILRTFRAIELLKLTGVSKEVIWAAAQFKDDSSVVFVAKKAMTAVATKDDIPFLSSQFASATSAALQEITLHALRVLVAPGLADQFEKWSRDKKLSEAIRLESTLALADLGDRRSLDLLLEMMVHADSNSIRDRSFFALRRLTGQNFKHTSFCSPEIRIKEAESWKKWIMSNGDNAKLNFPLDLSYPVQSSLNGNTLLTLSEQNGKVIEYDSEFNEVWSYDCWKPQSAETMSSGNVLIATWGDGDEGRVIEVNRLKEIVWEYPVRQLTSAVPLENGNVLLTSMHLKSAIELDRTGKVVWELKPNEQRIAKAFRLDNGNALVNEFLNNGDEVIAEVTPDGQRVWEFVQVNMIRAIQPLKNGNVLVACVEEVLEVKRTKEIVWRRSVRNGVDAFQTNDGKTLIRQTGGPLLELDRNEEKELGVQFVSYGSVRR